MTSSNPCLPCVADHKWGRFIPCGSWVKEHWHFAVLPRHLSSPHSPEPLKWYASKTHWTQ
eukprot:4814038-Amphidinium_carterae.1